MIPEFMQIYGLKLDRKNRELERCNVGILVTDGQSDDGCVRMDMHQYVKCMEVTMHTFPTTTSGEYLSIEIEGGYIPHHTRMVNNMEFVFFKKKGKMS